MKPNPHQVQLVAHGPLACFSRAEMKVERMSSDVITPSAARGILDAICWKPAMRWHVTRIEVLKPIRTIALRRNEVQDVLIPGAIKKWMKDPATFKPLVAGAGADTAGTPRGTIALKNVAYKITAEPIVYSRDPGETPTKFAEMFRRRLAKGQHFQMPCFGCREFAAYCDPPDGTETPIGDTRDLGRLLYDIVFDPKGKNNRAVFFHAVLREGVLVTDARDVLSETERKEVLACSYKR